jgi:hypothetical protein
LPQTSADDDAAEPRLLPETDFQLYAVATRAPRGLCRTRGLPPERAPRHLRPALGPARIRLIVLNAIRKHPRNAPWELFSADLDRIRHGAGHYHPRRPEAGALLDELYLRYQLELPAMSYTMADFMREHRERIINELTADEEATARLLERMAPEQRLRGLPPEERLRGLPPEERLRGLPPQERLRGLPPEELLRGLPPEERLRGLPPEELLRRLPPEERLRGLPPEERLRGLSAEELRRLKDLLRQQEG